MKKKVYIAGPYSKGDVEYNVGTALAVAERLMVEGHVPFVPHLTHFWHLAHPHSYQFWLNYDNEWLPLCDVLLRLKGESSSADEEVRLAISLNIPVFYDIVSLLESLR